MSRKSYTNIPNTLLLLRAAHLLHRHATCVHSSHVSVSANPHVTNTVYRNMSLTPLARLQACPQYPQGKTEFHLIKSHKGPQGKQRYNITLSLTLVLDRGRRSMPCHSRFTPGKKPSIYCTKGCVGPRPSLDGCKKSHPHRDSIPELSSP